MKKKKIRYHAPLWIILLVLTIFSCSPSVESDLDVERVKVALRSVGNQLLLSNQDSTSRVMPVVNLGNNKFEISFESVIAFDPGILNLTIQETFTKAQLPEDYLVEVIQCTDSEVAYSYEMLGPSEKNIIPCRGREVPENCYTIQVTFGERTSQSSSTEAWFYILVFLVIAFLILVFYSNYRAFQMKKLNANATALGSFRFYPDQNKLVKEAQEIPLSKKECELLAILAAQPNQIVKRDELSKKVWEDNGVIVGRSLDTYISKLRKKLQEDESVKLTNVHGVGYKLEIKN